MDGVQGIIRQEAGRVNPGSAPPIAVIVRILNDLFAQQPAAFVAASNGRLRASA